MLVGVISKAMERKAEGHRVMITGAARAEIDTRAPFGSVKEAVALFGERVLVGEVYSSKLKETAVGSSASPNPQSKIRALASQLEETKQTLQKTIEENSTMSDHIKTLWEELEQTKRELQKLKAREEYFQRRRVIDDPEINEELKFMEKQIRRTDDDEEEEEIMEEFEKRRFVKFASPPSLTRVIASKEEKKVLQRPSSVKKTTKKKQLVPLIGWLFSRKKGNQEDDHSPILGY